MNENYEFRFVDGYEDDPELARTKGWVAGTLTLSNRQRFQLYFATPLRLAQDATAEFDRGVPFYSEPNMILIGDVTRESVLSAVHALVVGQYLERFRPDSEAE